MKKLMMLACVAISVSVVVGCGSDEGKSPATVESRETKSVKDPYEKYLKQVKTCTNYPELELKVYRKAIKSVVDKCRQEGATSEALQDSAVSSVISQLPESFKMLKGLPTERETLEQMIEELEF